MDVDSDQYLSDDIDGIKAHETAGYLVTDAQASLTLR